MKTNQPKSKAAISAQIPLEVKDWLDSRKSKGLSSTNKLVNDLLNDRMLSEQAAWNRGERFTQTVPALWPPTTDGPATVSAPSGPAPHAYGEPVQDPMNDEPMDVQALADAMEAAETGDPTPCEHGRTSPHRIGTGNTTGPVCQGGR